MGIWSGGWSHGTEPFTHGVYLQANNVRIRLTSRTLGWHLRFACGCGEGLPTSSNRIWDLFSNSIPLTSFYKGGSWVQEHLVTLFRTQSEWPRLQSLVHFVSIIQGHPPKLWNKCLSALNRHLQFIIIVETLSLHCSSTWFQQQA